MADRSGYIGRAPGDSSVTIARQTNTATGVTTTFTFNAGYEVGYLDVYINGVRLVNITDYAATDTSTVTLTTPAQASDVVELVAYKAFNVSNVSSAAGNFSVGGDLSVSGSYSGDGSGLSGIVTGITAGDNISVSGSTGNVTITGLANTANVSADTLVVTGVSTLGVVTATSGTFTGDVSVGGTLTYQDVTNIDSVGMVTARKGIQVLADGLTVVGIVTASNGISVGAGQSIGSNGSAVVYYGDGSNLEGVVSGVEVESSGSSVGTSLTALNFVGATVEGDSSVGIATVTIASAGIETASQTVSNDVVILNLNSAQDHKVTATGICTITVQGGSEGESHTVRLVNSGVSTVGLSTYFLFPGGGGPSLPTADGAISLISFTVNRVGTAGTQLLTGASVNYS